MPSPKDSEKRSAQLARDSRKKYESNRDTDNEIKTALGLDAQLATVLRNAWRKGLFQFRDMLQELAFQTDVLIEGDGLDRDGINDAD